MRPRRAHAVLAMVFAASVALGCGGPATSGAATSTTPPREPSREERIAAGCAPTWEEALTRVGPLSGHEIPQTRGYSLAQNDPPPPPEPPLPEACHYPEGECRAVRYDARCFVRVDYRCGTSAEAFDTTEMMMPCDRPELP